MGGWENKSQTSTGNEQSDLVNYIKKRISTLITRSSCAPHRFTIMVNNIMLINCCSFTIIHR